MTLALLKAEIADDLGDSGLTTEIAAEITRAIQFYQGHDLYFNESRSETFSTVVGQVWYSSSDDASIGLIRHVDEIYIETSNYDRKLRKTTLDEVEQLTDANSSNAEPNAWTFYEEKIGLVLAPDAIYTMRMTGLFALAAPSDENDATNKWVSDAYDLIRYRVNSQLSLSKHHDEVTYRSYKTLEAEKLDELERKTGQRRKRGTLRAQYL